MGAPLVLIVGRNTPKADGQRNPAFAIGQPYLRAIRRAGGIPLMLPPDPGVLEHLDSLVPRVDALVLAGGGDVDPRRYGQPATAEELYGIVPDHDEVEFAVADKVLDRELPVLAICRGMQVVNVALGGTLHQHIGDDHWFVHHPVDVDAGSRLAKAAGEERLEQCHSVHHQAVDRLGDGLRITRPLRRRHHRGLRDRARRVAGRRAVAPRGQRRRAEPGSSRSTTTSSATPDRGGRLPAPSWFDSTELPRSISQPGAKPIGEREADRQRRCRRPRSTGTRIGSRASSPDSGSAIHTLTMIRRYRNAAITAATMAMIASA